MLDRVAKRYGCRPSDLLAGSVRALTVDIRCAVVGSEQDAKDAALAARKARHG